MAEPFDVAKFTVIVFTGSGWSSVTTNAALSPSFALASAIESVPPASTLRITEVDVVTTTYRRSPGRSDPSTVSKLPVTESPVMIVKAWPCMGVKPVSVVMSSVPSSVTAPLTSSRS